MKEGLASVIVCCFNGEGFIDSCFDCLLKQTCRPMEVIFVDDGSSDRSFEYIPQYAKEGIEFNCIAQNHKGAGGAAANGLRHATGEFISCFDVDDFLYPESVEKRKAFLERFPQYALVRTNGYKISPDGQEKKLFVTSDAEKKNEFIFEDLLLGRTNNWAGSYMVRAESLWKVFPDHHIPESKYGQNLQILMAAAWQNKAGFIDEPLMEYRFNPLSFTNTDRSFDAAFDRFLGYRKIREVLLVKLGIHAREIWNKLDITYSSLLLDLCIRHRKKNEYLEQYTRHCALETPACTYQYYYHLYSGHRFQSLVFRIACSKVAGQLFRFGIVGLIATALHYGLYLGLKRVIPITVAYIIGYSLSFIANYFLTARFTFRKKTSAQTGVGFLCAHLFNLALQTGLLNLFVYLGVSSSLAPIPVYAIAIPVNFLLVRFVFKGKEKISAA